ncbi:unnamed protein product [Caenorhabditis sp. 36 PRJEB53466]|nr:unnamed protein product [Caenorhabditis sp. 36 PRJEB53466]
MRRTTVVQAQHFKLLVVGGGAGGLGVASKFARKLPPGSVAVIEPRENHYYQPGFTLVGGGLMTLAANRRKQSDLIPKNATLIKDKACDEIFYDYMVVAVGLQLRFDMIKGAVEALETPGVCSNYSPFYVEKHFREASNFKGGNAVFTFPNTPIKCAGAPQKACYITDSILRQRGVRDKARMIYATSLKRLFGIESYLRSLEEVARDKEIDVRTRRNLIEVDSNQKIAIFELMDEDSRPTGKTEKIEYSLLHIGPPCSSPEALRTSELADKSGFMDVDPGWLQSKRFQNVFGVGDCMNTPNAKTAAAVSSHLKTIERNLSQVMNGNPPCTRYDGYASCPLVVSTNRVILAEFNSDGAMETTPFDQSKPSYWAYLMKRILDAFTLFKPMMLSQYIVSLLLVAIVRKSDGGGLVDVQLQELRLGQRNVCPHEEVEIVTLKQPCVQAYTKYVRSRKPGCNGKFQSCAVRQPKTIYFHTYKKVNRTKRHTVVECCPGWVHRPGEAGCQRENCSADLCHNGGTCVASETDNEQVCECPPGFTGAKCQYDVNECMANNGGYVGQASNFLETETLAQTLTNALRITEDAPIDV